MLYTYLAQVEKKSRMQAEHDWPCSLTLKAWLVQLLLTQALFPSVPVLCSISCEDMGVAMYARF